MPSNPLLNKSNFCDHTALARPNFQTRFFEVFTLACSRRRLPKLDMPARQVAVSMLNISTEQEQAVPDRHPSRDDFNRIGWRI